jgi:hypothetical protein
VGEQKALAETRLAERMPELADQATAGRVGVELRDYLGKKGYSQAEIAGVYDDRALEIAIKAMRYERSLAARAAANTKRTAATAPRVQRPGAQAPPADQSRRMAALTSRFGKTRSIGDAAAILSEWMGPDA